MALLKYPERLLQHFPSLERFGQELYAMFRVAGADATDIDPAAGPDAAPEPPPPSLGTKPGRDPSRVRSLAVTLPGGERSPAAPAPPDFAPPASRARPRGVAADRGRGPAPPAEVADRRIAAAEVPVFPRRREAPEVGPPPSRREDLPAPAPRREAAEPPGRRRRDSGPPPDLPRRAREPVPERKRRDRAPADLPAEPPGPVRKPLVPDPYGPLPLLGPVIPNVGGGGGGDTTVFLGKVVSHTSGKAASVELYGDGPEAVLTDTVQVKIPALADGESLPAGMWLPAVFLFTNDVGDNIYYSQPPIWLA